MSPANWRPNGPGEDELMVYVVLGSPKSYDNEQEGFNTTMS